MGAQFKFGEYLVKAGVITQAQLDQAVQIQEERKKDSDINELRPIGEIVHELFRIPPEVIENVFIHFCLARLTEEKIQNMMLNDPQLKAQGIDYVNSITGLEVTVPACNRRRADLDHMVLENGKLVCKYQESIEYRIDGSMTITFSMFGDRECKVTTGFAYKMKEQQLMFFADVLREIRPLLAEAHEEYGRNFEMLQDVSRNTS